MGMSVTISVATERDAEQIFRLQYLCFQSEAALYGNYRIDPLVQSLDSVRAEVTGDCVFVARLGDEVVGSVRGTTDDDGTAAIGKLCVHPRLQGHGIGARLLRAAEGALADERGVRLYRRVGYQAVGTSEGDDGVPMIVLEKQAPAGSYATTA
jgi:predicted N-acetyltransferase YhbS